MGSQQFREETAEVLKNLRRQQQALMEEIEQMRAALRDLDRLVRANLPTQLEALAALAKDIQAGLRSKADWAELKSKEGADMGIYATVDIVARAVASAINELSQSQQEYQTLLSGAQEEQKGPGN